jgi:hypothetical protein
MTTGEQFVADISNKVGNINGLKKFVIVLFPAPWSPVSAINQNI